MKIAIDFDGTIVDKKYGDILFNGFDNFIKNSNHDIYIVTARPSLSIDYISKYSNILKNKIICCGDIDKKINYLYKNKDKFDILIDDTKQVLDKCSIKFNFNFMEYTWEQLDFLINLKKSFSPGPVPQHINCDINFSHRGDNFFKLYKTTKNKVKKELNINKNILFTQGSGTSSIETVFSSMKKTKKIIVFSNGTFGDRAALIAEKYFDKVIKINNNLLNNIKIEKPDTVFYVQFETSKSKYNNFKIIDEYCKNNNIITIVDSVSSLGYYNIPEVDIVCASSAKILSGCPVMGIIIYNNKKIFAKQSKTYYFDIQRYIESDKNNQTPHTSLVPQFITLNDNISKRVTVKEINNNCSYLTTNKLNMQGEKYAPVITLKGSEKQVKLIIKWFNEFNIEPYYNSIYMKDYFQISMFNYKYSEVYKLINKIIEVIL